MGVGASAKGGGAGTKNFAFSKELGVDLQPDNRLELHHHLQ
jgi:hypothetical protein